MFVKVEERVEHKGGGGEDRYNIPCPSEVKGEKGRDESKEIMRREERRSCREFSTHT